MRNIGAARLVIMALVGLGMVGFFLFLMLKLSAQPMALLYNDLASSDAGAIGQKLDALKIPYEVNPEGTAIKVPEDEVGRARMALATDGLPRGGSIGYEIFDQSQGFGTTSFMQNLNQVRALEGELDRTVSSLAPVRNARIHLVLPKRELFSRDEQPATASVVLQLRPGAQLSHEQISAIRNLIASAVPQLKPGAVSIVDDRGNLLAKPDAEGTDGEGAQNNDDARKAYETRLSREIETLVGRTVGDNAVRATVTADLDFDRISTSQESYDPDQQVVRSTQSTEEKNDSSDSQKDAGVSVGNNIPGGAAKGGDGGSNNSTHGTRNEETINYEIGKTVKSQVRESGQVKKLSVAVLIDGTYTKDKDGKDTYAPRSKEEMKQIEDLVRSAVGYDQKRGDIVTVSNMRFAAPAEIEGDATASTGIMGFAKSDIMHLAETAVLGIVALLVVLLVVRPVINRIGTGMPRLPGPSASANNLLGAQGMPQQAALAAPTAGRTEEMPGSSGAAAVEEDATIDISQVEGRVRASSLRKIGDIVEKHPSEAVSILRGWMYQET
jgi:flagellar M-ring protein FliF